MNLIVLCVNFLKIKAKIQDQLRLNCLMQWRSFWLRWCSKEHFLEIVSKPESWLSSFCPVLAWNDSKILKPNEQFSQRFIIKPRLRCVRRILRWWMEHSKPVLRTGHVCAYIREIIKLKVAATIIFTNL